MTSVEPAVPGPRFAQLLAVPPRRRWLRVVVAGSVLAHTGVIAGLIVAGMWKIEKLTPQRTQLVVASTFGVPGPTAPAAPPPPARRRAATPSPTRRPVMAQPQPTDAPPEVEQSIDDGSPVGSDDGADDGADDGVADGIGPIIPSAVCAKPPCSGGVKLAPPPSCENGGRTDCDRRDDGGFTAPSVLEGLRLSGNTAIQPSDTDRTAMSRDGVDTVKAMVKVCLDAAGAVSSSSMTKPSGYPDYDQRFLGEIARWRYRPYTVDGRAVPVCSLVTFVYKIQ